MKTISIFYMILAGIVASAMASQQYDDLVKLVKSGATEDVIISYINTTDSSYNLTSDQVLELSKLGAPKEVIIAAMKHKISAIKSSPSAPTETTYVQQAPGYRVYRLAPYWRPWREARIWNSPEIAKMKQAVQFDVAGLLFGDLSLNCEYLFNHQYGIVIGGTYYPKYYRHSSHGENGELEYRWHWDKSMNSGFLGAFLNGGRFYGTDRSSRWDDMNNDMTYKQTSVTLGPDIGRRWVTDWGMSLVARVGYGYTWSKFENTTLDQHELDRINAVTGLDAELSIGFAF